MRVASLGKSSEQIPFLTDNLIGLSSSLGASSALRWINRLGELPETARAPLAGFLAWFLAERQFRAVLLHAFR
jgi:hypothetical protein